MKTKLTLSVEEPVIRTAKRLARSRGTTVSGLFTESVGEWEQADALIGDELGKDSPQTSALLGVLSERKPFDEKSARIRRKHG